MFPGRGTFDVFQELGEGADAISSIRIKIIRKIRASLPLQVLLLSSASVDHARPAGWYLTRQDIRNILICLCYIIGHYLTSSRNPLVFVRAGSSVTVFLALIRARAAGVRPNSPLNFNTIVYREASIETQGAWIG